MNMLGFGRTAKTFRPKKSTPVGEKGLELKRHVDVTLGKGNIYEAVKLPPGEDVREWLAVNTVDMYNAISVLYLTLVDFCTDASCPTMSAGPKYEYLWADGVKVKKPMKVTAPQYVNALFDWIEDQIDDSHVFPSEVGSTFPSSFKEVVKKIFKRLFRVYAHIYHSHFHEVCSLKAEAHLNTCFKHFILFAKHYDLVDEKEMAPLQELIEKLTGGVIP